VPKSDHLNTKYLIENARKTYGANWLREGAGVFQDILGHPSSTISSTPFDYSCLDAIFKAQQSMPVVTTTTAVIEPIPSDKEDCESFTTCNDGNTSMYYSMADSSVEGSKIDEKETSPDIETIVDSEDEPGNDESMY